MFIITNKRFTTLGNQIFEFMSGLYPNLTEVDIEVIPTDLTEDNVFGWTLENNDQNEIEIHNQLSDKSLWISISFWSLFSNVQPKTLSSVKSVGITSISTSVKFGYNPDINSKI